MSLGSDRRGITPRSLIRPLRAALLRVVVQRASTTTGLNEKPHAKKPLCIPMRQSPMLRLGKIVVRFLMIGGLVAGSLAISRGQTTVVAPRNGRTTIAINGMIVSPVPRLGTHTLAFQRLHGGGSASLTSAPIGTQTSGSTLLACIGRGELSAFGLPWDNKGNTAVQLGVAHPYTLWGSSGTALYAFVAAAGGVGHTLATSTPPNDEITMAVVEIKNGGLIKDYKWNEVLAGQPITSLSVTTTAAATLVAFRWGDAGVEGNKTAEPNNGFVVIDSILESGALVQCAVATKEVSAAGTYNVTWTSTPQQGAQLWLVAVQRAP